MTKPDPVEIARDVALEFGYDDNSLEIATREALLAAYHYVRRNTSHDESMQKWMLDEIIELEAGDG